MRSRARTLGACIVLLSACSRPAPHSEAASLTSARPASATPSAVADGMRAPADVARPPADAEVSASGVASIQLRAGLGGPSPKPNDCVRLLYTSWKRDGSFHASTAGDAEPAPECLRRTMPGLAEAIERMSLGEERRIWLPGQLTYRSKDAGDPAPTDDLTFDLTLLEVLRAPEVPSDLQAPPSGAEKTASGLRLHVLHRGAGRRKPRPNERMSVRFSGWTRDGVLFESTELGGSGPPASLTRADVVRGVGEGLALMQIGEKARLWVPAALAFGDKPQRGAPAGDLVYDLELVAVE